MQPAELVSAIHQGKPVRYGRLGFKKLNQDSRGVIAKAAYHTEGAYRDLPRKLEPTLDNAEAGQDYGILAYFPKAEHADALAESAMKLPVGAIAKKFPGAVGMLHYLTYRDKRPTNRRAKGRKLNFWQITTIQGCFKRDALRQSHGKIDRKYAAWKEDLVRHVFEKAKAKRVPFIVLNFTPELIGPGVEAKDEKGNTIYRGQGNSDAFTKVGDEMGFNVFSYIGKRKMPGIVAIPRA